MMQSVTFGPFRDIVINTILPELLEYRQSTCNFFLLQGGINKNTHTFAMFCAMWER